MKTKFLIAGLAIFGLFLSCQPVSGKKSKVKSDPAVPRELIVAPVVDLRVELMSIVARLAEIPSHIDQRGNPAYVAAIEKHFGPYRNHPVVEYMRYLHKTRGMSYNAVPAMAPFLTPLPELKPRVSFKKQTPEERWHADESEVFVKHLQAFVRDADCLAFFVSQRDRYDNAVRGLKPIYDRLEPEWFSAFFGISTLNSVFHPVIALGQGGDNYGGGTITLPDGTEEIYAFMGSAMYDSLGNPQANADWYLSTLVHEFNHSFVNPYLDRHVEEFRESGEVIFSHVADMMEEQAYGDWETTLNESLVRAGEIRYLKSHGGNPMFVLQKTNMDVNLGFMWLPELIQLLEEYEADRATYPDIDSFTPRLVEFYQEVAAGIGEKIATMPAVAGIGPLENGAQDVDPNTSEIHIYFTQPMEGKGYSFNQLPGVSEVVGYSGEGNKTFTIKVKLEPETSYEFIVLGGYSFRGVDGRSIQSYPVKFRTGPAK